MEIKKGFTSSNMRRHKAFELFPEQTAYTASEREAYHKMLRNKSEQIDMLVGAEMSPSKEKVR